MAQATASVLMLVRTSFANDSRVQKEAASLARAGWAVKVVALWEPGLRRREKLGGVEIVRPRSRLLRGLARQLGAGGKPSQPSAARQWLSALASSVDGALFGLQALVEVLRSRRPKVVHAHDLNVLPAAWLLSRLTRSRLVYDSHEIHPFSVSMQVRPPLWRTGCRRVERFCIRRAAAAITVNESCAKAIARIHRVPRPVVVHNAPALADRDARPPRGIREAIAVRPTDRIAVYSGSLSRDRGIEEAIRAIPLLPGVKLALLGYGEAAYLDSLRRLAAQLDLSERVFFVPPVAPSQVSAAIREADVSLVLIQDVALSYRFSSPNKLFESLHAGVPIVGAGLPEIRRVLRKFGCGLEVDARDPAAIALAIRQILDDPALRARLAAGARAAALQLNWENEEQNLLRAYTGVAGLRAPALRDTARATRESSTPS